jgi:methanol--5-hydroxybenzimidazolylcobamide Co-methyltransferase
LRFTSLCIADPDDLMFGRAPKPVDCGLGLRIGAGVVYPEVNFTLPAMSLDESSRSTTLRMYEEMAREVVARALALQVPGLVLEFEHLPPMTEVPDWGAEITHRLVSVLRDAHDTTGLPCALRVTPVDVRTSARPPQLRSGKDWETLRQSFVLCAEAGAHILSIESIGGKEVCDEALLSGDIEGIAFALGVLGARDMAWLWDEIVSVCRSQQATSNQQQATRPAPPPVPGGDSACGFANTAMQLAHQRLLPETLAAVVRAMGAARSLVAFERGAVGPSKDCAYEGPVLKAIAGCPLSMEGKSAACAHFSPVGNIAAGMCDLWSNESVQHVPLLSGPAPAVFTEVLAYDCRLMNEALRQGQEKTLRDLLVASDRYKSPQALVLSPEATVTIASAIVGEQDDYRRTAKAALAAAALVREAVDASLLPLSSAECRWLDRIQSALAGLPQEEGESRQRTDATYGHLYDPASYGLE